MKDTRAKINALREARAREFDGMLAISDDAEIEGRDLNAQEATAYREHRAEFDRLTSRIERLEREDENGGAPRTGLPDMSSRGIRPRNVSDIAARALNVNEQAGTVPDDARQKVALAIEADTDPDAKLARYVIATGDEQYASAFRKWLRDPMNGHRLWTEGELRAVQYADAESRAMSLGTTTAGGFLVSYELDPQILISGTGSVNPMRNLARVEVVSHKENRFVTSAGVTASWDAEAEEVSDDTPTLAQPAITAHKGQAFVPVSYEIFEDSPDLGAQLQRLFVDSKEQLEATAFTTGSGTGQAKGIITAIAAVGGSVVATSGGTTPVLVDVVANQNALPARWRPNAKWMANLSIINGFRQLAKGATLTESLVDDSTDPPKMLGWELHENSVMDGTVAGGATADYVLLSGDFKQYIITDRIGTTVEFVQNLFGDNNRPTGQRGFLLHWRTGGDAVITDAFRLTDANG